MFNLGNVANCRRCHRPIILLPSNEGDGFLKWHAQVDDYPRDCPERRGENCTPYPPETW